MIRIFRSLPKPAPGFWTAFLCLALAFVYLTAFVMTAEGQVRQVGVGLPGVPRPDFHFRWCEQKRPPGRQATCTIEAPADFDCRLCPSNGWSGYYAEFYQRTTAAMRGAWEANFWGTRTSHDGVVVQSSEPTPGIIAAEFSWVEVTYPRTHEIYRRFWYEAPGREGGTEASPIVIDLSTLRFNTDRIDCIKALGAWPAPGETGSYIGFDPIYPADVCANRFPPPGARPLWPVWVRNALPADHPVNGGSAPPPPPPVPVPAPPPPEPTTPPCPPSRLANCEGLLNPFGQSVCAGCPCPSVMPPREKLYHCTPVVEEPPPVEPPPALCPPTAFELRCLSLGGSEDLCLSMARYVGACDPECDSQCFIPGVPSTGGLEVVLVPGVGP